MENYKDIEFSLDDVISEIENNYMKDFNSDNMGFLNIIFKDILINHIENNYSKTIDIIKEVVNNYKIGDDIADVYINDEGVYCRYIDNYFSDIDSAVECLRSDEDFIKASFLNYASFVNCPYIENHRNGETSDISSRLDVQLIDDLDYLKDLDLDNETSDFVNEYYNVIITTILKNKLDKDLKINNSKDKKISKI